MYVLCCQVEVSATDRSLVQRNFTEYRVSDFITESDQVQQQLSTPTVIRYKRKELELLPTVNSGCYPKQGLIIGLCNEVECVLHFVDRASCNDSW